MVWLYRILRSLYFIKYEFYSVFCLVNSACIGFGISHVTLTPVVISMYRHFFPLNYSTCKFPHFTGSNNYFLKFETMNPVVFADFFCCFLCDRLKNLWKFRICKICMYLPYFNNFSSFTLFQKPLLEYLLWSRLHSFKHLRKNGKFSCDARETGFLPLKLHPICHN